LILEIDIPQGHGRNRVALDRVWRLCQSDPPACDEAARDFLSKTVRTLSAPVEVPVRDQIVAVLRPRAYIDAIGGPSSDLAIVEPFVEDLYVVYMVDLPDATRGVVSRDLEALKVTRADLPSLARANLAARLGSLRDALAAARAGDLMVVQTGNFFESSRLLLADDWASLAARLHKTVVVAVPGNDVVIVAVDPTVEMLVRLRDVVHRMHEASQRPVSERLLRWDSAGWAAVR
jgi:hypothetical protein